MTGDTRNDVSGVVIGPTIMGRDIRVELPAQVPPATSGLPAASPSFTGRQEALDWLLAALRPSGSAVIVSAVGGLAGVGKTELAVQAAHAALLRGWFPGGVLFADMFGYDEDRRRDPSQVLAGLLRALQMPGEHIPEDFDGRVRMFRSVLAEFGARGRRVLVVADNVNAAHHAEMLLPTDGMNAAIVTSRHTLAMLNARLLDLNVLDPDAAVTMLDEAVRVARPSDTRVPSDPDGAVRLAELCGWLPLALRIAAALLAEDPALSPSALAGELTDARPVEGLTYGSDGVARAFERSYRTLAEPQQRMFRLLSVNPGPEVSTQAAAALAAEGSPAAVRTLKDLARAHLIERGTAAGRWRMHDLVRQYATDLAESSGDPAALARLLRYYAETVRAAVVHLDPRAPDPGVRGFATREEALAWLDVELPNLLAAVEAAAGSHPAFAVVLPLDLAEYLARRRHFTDLIALTTLAQDAAERTGDRSAQAAALNNLGNALQEVRRFEEAVIAHQRAQAIYRAVGRRDGEARAVNNLGLALREVRRFEEAVTAHERALVIYQKAGDRYGEGTALNYRGTALQMVGRHDEAITAYRQAQVVFREVHDQYSEATALSNLGTALRDVERYEEAITAFEVAQDLYREVGIQHGEGVALLGMGEVLRHIGRRREAVAALTAAVAILKATDDEFWHARAVSALEEAT